MSEDERDILKDEKPFSYKATKNGELFIYWKGKMIMTLSSKKSSEILKKIDHKNEYEIQLILAKTTGHFKHSNE